MQAIDQRIHHVGSLLHRFLSQLGVARSGRGARVPQQCLDVAQAQALFEQVCGKGMTQRMDADLAADASFSHHRLHGGLRTTGIHVGRGLANPRHRAGSQRKQPLRVAMLAPQRAQGVVREVGQRYQSVLMPLAAPDVDLAVRAVNVADLKRDGLPEAKAHRVGHQQENAVAQFARGADQLLDLSAGENIREGLNTGSLDEIEPGPVALQDVLPEELEAVAIDLHRAPGMRVDEFGEVGLQLRRGEPVGAAVKALSDSTHRPTAGIDGVLAFP